MMQLTAAEWAVLRSQFVTSKTSRGGRRYLPFAFTEQGVAMLSSVLGSERAIAVNIEIMRAFVRMRGTQAQACWFHRQPQREVVALKAAIRRYRRPDGGIR
jgi:ORF6N domain